MSNNSISSTVGMSSAADTAELNIRARSELLSQLDHAEGGANASPGEVIVGLVVAGSNGAPSGGGV